MQGKRGLIMGVANDRSLAWGIAAACAAQGAELAFTFQGEALERRVRPLAASVGSDLLFPCDVADEASIDAAFAALQQRWDRLDFLVHAIAYADKAYLRGRYLDTPRAAFLQALDISCYSFVAVAQRAVPMMQPGASLLTPDLYRRRALDAALQRHGRREGGAGGVGALSGRRSRRPEHPGERDQRRADQDAGGVRHRRLPLHPALEPAQFADAAQRHDRGGRRRRRLPAVRLSRRRDRRGAPRRLRLPYRRHEEPRRAGHRDRREDELEAMTTSTKKTYCCGASAKARCCAASRPASRSNESARLAEHHRGGRERGREQLHAVESCCMQALVRMLKADGWPLSRDVDNWRADTRGFLAQARRRFAPSMRQNIDVPGLYADALAALPEKMDGQPPQPLPQECPMTLNELLAEGGHGRPAGKPGDHAH